MKRRQFIKALGLGAAVATPALAITQKPAERLVASGHATLGATPLKPCLSAQNSAECVKHLFEAADKLKAHAFHLSTKGINPCAIRVPLATLPINRYVDERVFMKHAPKVEFPAWQWLQSKLANDHATPNVEGIINNALIKPLNLKFGLIHDCAIVNGVCVKPVRIVTEQYVVDIGAMEMIKEADNVCAGVLANIVIALNNELRAACDECPATKLIATPVKLFVKKEAFMMSCFAYTHIANAEMVNLDPPNTSLGELANGRR